MSDFLHPELLSDEQLDTVNENICLIRKKDGLTYGTDAYLLAAFIRPAPRAVALELGSGTGIIPLLLCRRDKVARVIGTEIQPDFAALIDRNAALNGLSDRVHGLCMDVRALNQQILGKALGKAEGATVDVVFSNPPYMRVGDGRRNDSDAKYIARHECCGDIGDFCAAAGRVLRYGGTFYVVYRPDRLAALVEALSAAQLEPKRMTFVHADAESEPSMVLLEAKAGGNAGLIVTPPLFLHDTERSGQGTRPLTLTAQRVYEAMEL